MVHVFRPFSRDIIQPAGKGIVPTLLEPCQNVPMRMDALTNSMAQTEAELRANIIEE